MTGDERNGPVGGQLTLPGKRETKRGTAATYYPPTQRRLEVGKCHNTDPTPNLEKTDRKKSLYQCVAKQRGGGVGSKNQKHL